MNSEDTVKRLQKYQRNIEKIKRSKKMTIEDVIIRVSEKFSLAMHMDYDEANACSYKKGDMGYIIKKN